jgi:hypothetical protein
MTPGGGGEVLVAVKVNGAIRLQGYNDAGGELARTRDFPVPRLASVRGLRVHSAGGIYVVGLCRTDDAWFTLAAPARPAVVSDASSLRDDGLERRSAPSILRS